MKTFSIIATEQIKPLDPKTYQSVDWGLVVFTVLLAPVALEGFRNLFTAIQRKGLMREKTEDSERQSVEKIVEKSLANKDAVFSSFQQQNAQLLNEVLTAREEDIKNLQASQATMVQVLATVADNLKTYAQMAIDRSNETKHILDKIQTASERTVVEAMNSHIRLTQIGLRNQEKILSELKDTRKLQETIIQLLEAVQRQ